MPLSVPWIWRAPATTAASELATACSVSLWAWMPRCDPGTSLATRANDRRDLLRQAAAIGVAQHHPARAGLEGRPGAGERIVGIGLEAVEEMLAIEQRLAAGRRAASTVAAIASRFSSLLMPSATRTWKSEALATKQTASALAASTGQAPDHWRGERPGALGHAEGGEARRDRPALGEKRGVDRIGAGIAALDVVDAEASSISATTSLSSREKSTPGVCWPSRSVVSKR